jgi:predicted NAD-dependent protein-ADP-ribosyltransferase YbiA (DUF1768 family)
MPYQPNKKAQEVRHKMKGLYSEDDKRRNYTMFCASSSKDSELYRLSNLSSAPIALVWPNERGIPEFLWGEACRYDTTEHAYQALKTLNRESARKFETGGIVNMEIFKTWPNTSGTSTKDEYANKMKCWGVKGEGIAPKMVSNLEAKVAKKVFGLDMRDKKKRETRSGDVEEELKVWGCILRAKFSQNLEAQSILLGTEKDILIEKSRMPSGGKNYWAGYVAANDKDGRIDGMNMMGRLLMHIRAEILSIID